MNRLMLKLLALLLACAPLLPAHAQAPVPPEVAARSYLLLDVTSGQLLAQKDADSPVEPA